MPRKAYTTKLTDKDVLRLFDAGKYRIDDENWIILNAKGKPLFTYQGSRDAKYLWTRLYEQPRHRAIAVHVCIWIVTNRVEIPEGWHVHHDNENVTDNRPENLFCLHPLDHAKLHRLRNQCLTGIDHHEEVPF